MLIVFKLSALSCHEQLKEINKVIIENNFACGCRIAYLHRFLAPFYTIRIVCQVVINENS